MRLIIIYLIMFFASSSVVAESMEEKVLKLRATNDALTERVAELLQENRRLQTAVQGALSAQNTGARIVRGCDTSNLHKSVAMTSGPGAKGREAQAWLAENGMKCTKEQLRLIMSKLPLWANELKLYFNDALSLAQYYLEN